MPETLRIVFSNKARSYRKMPLLSEQPREVLSPALLRLLRTYRYQARQSMLQPSQQTMGVLLRAVYE